MESCMCLGLEGKTPPQGTQDTFLRGESGELKS